MTDLIVDRTELTELELEFINKIKTINSLDEIDNINLTDLNNYMLSIADYCTQTKRQVGYCNYLTKEVVLDLELSEIQWNVLSFFQVIHIEKYIPFCTAILQYCPLFIRTLEYYLSINDDCEKLRDNGDLLKLFTLCYEYTNTYDVLEDKDTIMRRMFKKRFPNKD